LVTSEGAATFANARDAIATRLHPNGVGAFNIGLAPRITLKYNFNMYER
jgi:hypothetical protein